MRSIFYISANASPSDWSLRNVQAPNASPWSQSYAWDAARRLSSISSPAGSFNYDYTTVGDPGPGTLVQKLTLPNGAYITNSFDLFERLTNTTLKTSAHAVLNPHAYQYDNAHRCTRQTRLNDERVDYTYDSIGQLKSALGQHGTSTNRWHERFFYTYDPAGNLSNRVQNVLTNVFNINHLNQLTSVVRTNNSLTVAGTTWGAATSVTVADNGNPAVSATRYADNTFARTNVTLLNGTNTFTAVAADGLGRQDTNTVTINLPTTVTLAWDRNGNLRTNGNLVFAYDDENQLIAITNAGAWASVFIYDGKMRQRVRKEYVWRSGIWNLQSEIRYVYDGMLVIQERDANNLPTVTYTRGLDLSGSLEGAGGIGGLLARVDHGLLAIGDSRASAYYHADGNGNVTMLISTQQLAVAKYL
jgi:YD repeat-containing protein